MCYLERARIAYIYTELLVVLYLFLNFNYHGKGYDIHRDICMYQVRIMYVRALYIPGMVLAGYDSLPVDFGQNVCMCVCV